MNPLIQMFPISNKVKEIRQTQKEALDLIWDAIQSNQKKLILRAPTGSGKSLLAETVIRYFQSQGKSSLYTSPLNSLVFQVRDNQTSDIITLVGKRYYDCIAKGNGIKCDDGYCARKICYMTRNAAKGNRMKRNCKDCRVASCVCRNCLYKAQFRKYRESSIGNTNSSLWLMGIVPNETSVLVIDEVDSLEDFVRMNCTVSVPYHVNSDDFAKHIEVATDYADKIKACLDCEKDYDCVPRNISRLESKINSIRNMANDFEKHQEPWVIRNESKTDKIQTRYEPITVTRFTEPLVESLDFVLTMSATPPRWPNYQFIEVPSPFPVDIRQCYYKPLGRFDFKNREANLPKLAEFLTTLRGKTIVHCNSYAFASPLVAILQKNYNIYPLLQVRQNGKDPIGRQYMDYEPISRYNAIDAFVKAKDQNKIYLSVNMGRGVDLWQPEIQNNVIAVIPWSDPTDLLTIAKTNLLGESWKSENTAITIDQEHGRIHRGIYYLKDVIKERPDLSWLPVNTQGMVMKRTFITDSNFNNGRGRLMAWYARNKKYFSQSFNEVMRL